MGTILSRFSDDNNLSLGTFWPGHDYLGPGPVDLRSLPLAGRLHFFAAIG